LQEADVTIQCRPEDLDLVNSVLNDSKNKYEKRTESKVEVSLNKKHLPSHPECFGGILLTAQHGRIVCNNTLDARLKMAYDVSIPRIRYTLFNEGGNIISKKKKKLLYWPIITVQ